MFNFLLYILNWLIFFKNFFFNKITLFNKKKTFQYKKVNILLRKHFYFEYYKPNYLKYYKLIILRIINQLFLKYYKSIILNIINQTFFVLIKLTLKYYISIIYIFN